MKKTIAMMLVLAGCMTLAGCAGNEEIQVTEASGVTEERAVSEESAEAAVTESDGAGESESSESQADVQAAAGGYMRYTYTIDDATGERTLSKVEEYDGDGHLLSDMNYGSIGQYGVTNVYVNGVLTEEWYTNTDGETYLSSRVESAVFGENERISISYHYDHEDYIGYTEYSYDEQGEHRVRVSDYDAGGCLTEYDEYVYDEDGSAVITEYNADGTPTGRVRMMDPDGFIVRQIDTYDTGVYRSEYIRDENGNAVRYEHYENDVLLEYTIHEFDSEGRRVETTCYHADGSVIYHKVCEYEYL